MDHLKEEIKENISALNQLSGGEPSMMAMQILSMVPIKKSAIQRQAIGSFIGGIVSINQKRSINLKNSANKLQNRLPSMVQKSRQLISPN